MAPGTGARDRDPAGLQRRPQGLQGVAAELAELVEEEDAAMGERRLAGARGLPPPTSPAGLTVWWGARNGRPPAPSPPRRPQALAIRATSSASSAARGGRIEGRRLAASDLPAPGGPTISKL